MKLGSLGLRFIVSSCSTAAAFGWMHSTEPAKVTEPVLRRSESAKPATPEIAISDLRDAPIVAFDEIEYKGHSLQLFEGDEQRAPHVAISQGQKIVKVLDMARGTKLRLMRLDHFQADPYGDAVLRLARRGRYSIVESVRSGSYTYFVFDATNAFSLVDTIHSGVFALEPYESHKKILLSMTVAEDQLDEFGARTVMPTINLLWQWNGKHFRLANSQTTNVRIPEFEHMIREEFAKYDPGSEIPIASAPPELAEEVLSRYYSGDAISAYDLLSRCWPKHRAGKDNYWKFLLAEGKDSPLRKLGDKLRQRGLKKRLGISDVVALRETAEISGELLHSAL